MPRTLRASPKDPDIQRLETYLGLRATGWESPELWETLEVFQLQHLGPDGKPLLADGEVGPKTWWALEHPSGPGQKSGHPFPAFDPRLRSGPRRRAIELLRLEYQKGVHESPDGSNRGPEIDGYWGGTGLLGLPWCCAFVSAMLFRTLGRYPLTIHHVSVQRMLEEAERLGMVTATPCPLDVFVQLKPSGKGHTGFGVAFEGSRFATIEGNAGNRVKNGRRELSTVQAWIDPWQDGATPFEQPLDGSLADLSAATTR